MLCAEWFFIEGKKVRMPTKRQTAGWHMYQGVVHTSLRLRSRIYNNSLGERLLFRAWNFPHSKQASSQQGCLWMWKRDHLVPWKQIKVCTSSRPRLCPCKNLRGGLNWCPSIHPSTTEKISISLRPGLGLRSPIVERNNLPQDKIMLMSKFTEIWLSRFQLQF